MSQAIRSRNTRGAKPTVHARNSASVAAPDALTTIGLRHVAPDDYVADVMAMARREHLVIVTNGQRFALCSVIPAGWRSLGPREYASAPMR